ncbi:MAG: tRNA (adenosine(37)-N6)-threonylcarbamoyltransferase complex dimerization subunit type 1 TsaB, partial [Bacteroidota bacterium]
MTVLGLETSTDVCSVGLIREQEIRVERSVIESHIHSEKLLTLVQEVLKQAGMALADLEGIGVSVGPGSFTGLRIGLSSAKGLAFALDKPLAAVPTFQAIASAAFERHPDIHRPGIVLDAKQGDFYTAVFERTRGGFHETEPVGVRNAEEIVAMVSA